MGKYVIVTESGADIPSDLAAEYEIHIVPMHISFGQETKDDGTFPAEEVFAYYDRTRELPKTSGCTLGDFRMAFEDLHRKYPDRHIFHLAYSAAITSSYQNARIAGEGLDYVTSVDTKFATAAQGVIVLAVADYLSKNPDSPLEEVLGVVERLRRACNLCFFPGDLTYLKAGGRISNAAYLGAKMLSISPRIEMENGEMVVKRKYRGSIDKNAVRLLQDFVEEKKLDRRFLALGDTSGLNPEIRQMAVEAAKKEGFEKIIWLSSGGVISVHGGPGCFGICGFSEEKES